MIMYSAIFTVIKPFLPIIAVALILAGAWFAGYAKGREQLHAYRAVIEAQSTQVKEQAQQHAIEVNERLRASAEIINAQAEQHAQQIEALATDNRTLLAQRLQQSAGRRCSRLPETTGSTSSGTEDASRYWMVSETVANRLIERHTIADQVIETAQSCQQYVKSIQEQINGSFN